MKKGEIWIVEIPSGDGHEQSGRRPVIVLHESEANICVVVPVTSNLHALRYLDTLQISPTTENGLCSISVALLFQIRAIDKMRIVNKIGTIDSDTMRKIDNTLKQMLKL